MKFFQLSIFDGLFLRRPDSERLFTRPAPPVRVKTKPRSSAELQALWKVIRNRHFPDRADLDDYVVTWSSRRQKRTLASCNMRQRRVLVARELNTPEHARWLDPLLYHEMCHAVIGLNVERYGSRRAWHGREFRELERRHSGIAELDRWIKSGGWQRAVRSERSRTTQMKRALRTRSKFRQ